MYFSWRPKKPIALVMNDDALACAQEPETCLRENPAGGWEDINTAHIGCAISPDGIRDWKVMDQCPLVIPDPGTWDSCAC